MQLMFQHSILVHYFLLTLAYLIMDDGANLVLNSQRLLRMCSCPPPMLQLLAKLLADRSDMLLVEDQRVNLKDKGKTLPQRVQDNRKNEKINFP